MIGKYSVEIISKRLHYNFEIKRNITILSGFSGTGKTTLIRMVLLSKRRDSPYTVNCATPCVAFTVDNFDDPEQLRNIDKSIIFLDEDIDFVRTREFANIVKNSTNYFVIATREPLYMLPYSYNEVYRLEAKQPQNGEKYIEDSMHAMYQQSTKRKVDLTGVLSSIIVEDKNSGFDFYKSVADRLHVSCVSADGNANVIKLYEELIKIGKDTGILIVVDGAAYGAYFDALVKITKQFINTMIFIPESFEYVLLKSGVCGNFTNELQSTWNYAESAKYFSWERYYTTLLINSTEHTSLQYSKHRLNREYLLKNNYDKIMKILPNELGLKIINRKPKRLGSF